MLLLNATGIIFAALLKIFNSTFNVLLRDVGKKAQIELIRLLGLPIEEGAVAARTLFLAIRFGVLSTWLMISALLNPSLLRPLEPKMMRFYFTKSVFDMLVMYLTYAGYLILDDYFSLAVAAGAIEPIFSMIISLSLGLEQKFFSLFALIFISSLGMLIRCAGAVAEAMAKMSATDWMSPGAYAVIFYGVGVILLAKFFCAAKHHFEKLVSRDNPFTVTFYTCLFNNFILILLLCILGLTGSNINFGVIAMTQGWVRASFALAAGMSFMLLFFGSWIARRLDTDVNIVLGNISIPVALLYSSILYKKIPNLEEIFGSILIITGAVLISYRQSLKRKRDDFKVFNKIVSLALAFAIITAAGLLICKVFL